MTSWRSNNTLESRRLVEEVLGPAGSATTRKVVARDRRHLKSLIEDRIKKFRSNCDLNDIDVSHVTDMSLLFQGHPFNLFNGDISQWDVSSVKNMRCMFWNCRFKGDISNWNVSNVEDMSDMFRSSKFNGDISNWDVSNVTNMGSMFSYSNFNGDISKWDVSNVTNMNSMFYGSNFNSDISKWDVSNVRNMKAMFDNCPIEEKYKPKFKK